MSSYHRSFFSTSSILLQKRKHQLINTTSLKNSFDWEIELRRRQQVAKERCRKRPTFVDTLKIEIRAGDGGDGGVSFHREKFVARGGPSGGNGGKGGSIYIRPTERIHSLNQIPKILNGLNGSHGGGEWKNGKSGEDIILDVPIGTIIKEIKFESDLFKQNSIFNFGPYPPKLRDLMDEDPLITKTRRSQFFVHYPQSEDQNQSNELLKQLELSLLQDRWESLRSRHESIPLQLDCASLYKDYQTSKNSTQSSHSSYKLVQDSSCKFLIAKGGEGGMGNSNFIGNQTLLPRFATRGKKGEVYKLELELKTLADVGLVGFPNSGKSTLIHTLTNSRSEIAPYEFTTLHPQIGTLIIYTDGTWDTGDQTLPIHDSPTVQEHHDQHSATRSLNARTRSSTFIPKNESARLTIADCPGLLPKASMNVGLGHAFLRHIERSRILVVVLDILAGLKTTQTTKEIPTLPNSTESELDKPCRDVEMLMKELEEYQSGLSGRVMIVVANKADLSTLSPQLEQQTKLRLKVLNEYLRILVQNQISNGIRNQKDHKIELVVMSAKHRQNAKILKQHKIYKFSRLLNSLVNKKCPYICSKDFVILLPVVTNTE